MRGPAIALLLLALPAAAQEVPSGGDVELLAECYGGAETIAEKRACIGMPASACEAETPQGDTTMGIARCAGIEADAWDIVMEAEFRLTMDQARSADAAEPPRGDLPPRVEALRASQRGWETFYEAQCLWETARWGSGSMARVAGSRCRMRMLGERAVQLREMRTP